MPASSATASGAPSWQVSPSTASRWSAGPSATSSSTASSSGWRSVVAVPQRAGGSLSTSCDQILKQDTAALTPRHGSQTLLRQPRSTPPTCSTRCTEGQLEKDHQTLPPSPKLRRHLQRARMAMIRDACVRGCLAASCAAKTSCDGRQLACACPAPDLPPGTWYEVPGTGYQVPPRRVAAGYRVLFAIHTAMPAISARSIRYLPP